MFFGYTQCPDVCPTTLVTLAETMKPLGPDADRVQVLFVTVDPERDTPALLAEYVPAFDKRFVGLSGDAAATETRGEGIQGHLPEAAGRHARRATRWTTRPACSCSIRRDGCACTRATGRGPEVFAHDLRELLRSAAG